MESDRNMLLIVMGDCRIAKRSFDLHDGNLVYDLHKTLDRTQQSAIKPSNTPLDPASIHETIRMILRSETSLDLAKYTIIPQSISTRHTIDAVLGKLADNGKVALPVPNWTFWLTAGAKAGKVNYDFLQASCADELVNSFAKNADKVKALLLVNPTNPWGYTLQPSHCAQIDQIAQKHGVSIVIDEVLRGNQPLGARESLGSQFSNPYIIEGFSHRFGTQLRNFSYVLAPQNDLGLTPSTVFSPSQIETIYARATRPVLEEVKRRNLALAEGLYGLDLILQRTADTQITSLLKLPDEIDAARVQRRAMMSGLTIGTVHFLLPKDHPVPNSYRNTIRLSVGTMDVGTIYDAADLLSQAIKKYR